MIYTKLAQCRYGTMIYNVHDKYIGGSLELYGEWSEAEAALFRQLLRPGDVVVEAGANIGSLTVPLSQCVGETGRVIAFEPSRHNFHILCGNISLNDCFNVEAHHAAVGAHEQIVSFPVIDPRFDNNFGGLSLKYGQEIFPQRENVPMITVDSLKLDRLDFLKADVEGFEMDVLRGSLDTLARLRPILHVEYIGPFGEIHDQIVEMLGEKNYFVQYYVTPVFNPNNYRNNPENIFKGTWSFDLICMPRERGEIVGLVDAFSEPWNSIHDDSWWKAEVRLAGREPA